MFQWLKANAARSALAQAMAFDKSQALIEFALDGTIVTANENYLATMGYVLGDIHGRHHSMLVSPHHRDSAAYREFWAALNLGVHQSGEFKRLGSNGREVWFQGAYNPILDDAGKPVRVVQSCNDITAQKLRSLDDSGKVAAIERSQAMIEFDLDGTILSANQLFLDTMGYVLQDIRGKHHSMFVLPADRDSSSYRAFWAALNRGESQAAEFKRVGKGGAEVWILATYNPILDESGKPIKIVKFASDVTEQKLLAANFSGQIEAIGKSQAVIEFNLDGTVLNANDNFLSVLGYALSEIQGKHHSMFVPVEERGGDAYAAFWASLRRGDYQTAEYQRVGKNGRQVWIQASYNPIMDLNGQPYKVVKYASDVTAQVIARMKSERVRGMMESVAAGAEELSASVREISDTMVKSRDTAMSAVGKVDVADGQAQRLTSAAQAMSGIVELIGNITGQINLLALNATIESARAGEAGRGFAVVASEVKNLATQAKQATDRISNEISSLNGISSDVVHALNAIKTEIQSVSEYVNATAAAVEQQSVVTSGMSNSMLRAAEEAASIGH
ncbi:MAG: PAS domain-containing methyl-accepting chemotaxis protein [Hyphomicrobiales bacterium]|nr:PAS domain-containing methyl-accepting chemotaxis protein [Hyphomicrobiales bacterium]